MWYAPDTCHTPRAPSTSGLYPLPSTRPQCPARPFLKLHHLQIFASLAFRSVLFVTTHDTVIVMSMELDLGTIQLHHFQSRLRLASRTSIKLSSTDRNQKVKLIRNEWSAIENVWMCRGQGLALKFYVTLHGESLHSSYLHELGRAICNSKVRLSTKPVNSF
jgi:hypothetical protein